MVIAPSVVMDCRMMDVKHFVEDDVLDHVARNIVRIERAADDDRFVGRIMMSKYAICLPGRPCENRFSEPTAEVPKV